MPWKPWSPRNPFGPLTNGHCYSFVSQFKDALAKDQKRFSLDAPLTDADREFLQAIFVPAAPNQSTVDLSRLSDEKIQGYAIVLKIIAGKNC